MVVCRGGRSKFAFDNALDLIESGGAGILASGDSGSGKSNLLQLLFQRLVKQDAGVTLIDPHGDLAADCERFCSALPRRLRDKCLIVRPSNLSHVVAMNPLAVPAVGTDRLTWRARIASKVGLVSKILLHAWGEHDFNAKPLLFKWTSRSFTTLAGAGMTIPDVRHFFHIGSPVYQALTRTAPDLLARVEMEELADMRPRDREELIASTKNRTLGFLENPAVELSLGRPGGWLDVPTLLRERYVTIVSLEKGGVLRDEDVEIFANLWLNEILYAAYNLPRHERQPHFVMLDELPVFASSYPLITAAAAQVRKFFVRLCCAFQGTQLFPERTEDRLLHALIGQCNVHWYFRHKNPIDAKFFGEILKLRSLDALVEKHRLTQLQQYQDGNDLVYLVDETANWSDAEQTGGSQTNADSNSTTDTDSRSRSSGTTDTRTTDEQRLAEAVSRARSEQAGDSTSRAASRGTTRTDGTNWSATRTQGRGRTRKATLVPRIRTREVVTSVQFFSTEEKIVQGASGIARQETGEATLYVAGRDPVKVMLPLAAAPFAKTPKFSAKKLSELRQEIISRPEFMPAATLLEERRQFECRLVEHLERLLAEEPASETLRLPEPPDNGTINI